jgi:hypothetical protein
LFSPSRRVVLSLLLSSLPFAVLYFDIS